MRALLKFTVKPSGEFEVFLEFTNSLTVFSVCDTELDANVKCSHSRNFTAPSAIQH